MKILALESSAVAAGVALTEDENLIAQSFLNCGLTHSATLLPMVEALLAQCGTALGDIDLIAVSAGPGSFTGVRIGVATAKGLAWPLDLPCAAVSPLEAMAWQVSHVDGEISAAMDARRAQIYHARFLAQDGTITRLTPDRALSAADAAAEAAESQFVVGDGALLCYNELIARGIPARLAPPHLRFQTAWGVARAALEMARRGETVSAADLTPSYLRLSQAERERLEKEQNA